MPGCLDSDHPGANPIDERGAISEPSIVCAGSAPAAGFVDGGEEVLRRAAADRDHFLATTAHRLRTPLTRLLLLSSNLARRGNVLAQAETIRQAEAIAAQTEMLVKLVDDLIDAPKMAAGLLPMSFAAADLSELVRTSVSRLRSGSASTAEIELELHHVPGLWDAIRVDQVIHYLLMNAANVHQRRPIHLALCSDGSWARLVISVRQGGLPMDRPPAEISEAVPFVDVQGAEGELGLWVVDQVTRAMGGHFRYGARRDGSISVVELPRRR